MHRKDLDALQLGQSPHGLSTAGNGFRIDHQLDPVKSSLPCPAKDKP
jgi:hypothetical protein